MPGYFVIAALWLWWELRAIAMRDYHDQWPAFAEIVKKYVPRWGQAMLIAAFSSWLVEHS